MIPINGLYMELLTAVYQPHQGQIVIIVLKIVVIPIILLMAGTQQQAVAQELVAPVILIVPSVLLRSMLNGLTM